MRLSSAKYSLLLLLACSFAGKIEATGAADADECCRSSCYECSCEPLYPCAFDVQLQAGAAPIVWRHRGQLLVVRCGETSEILPILDFPKFSKLFHVPWTVGGQIGYALSCNARLFVEFDYYQARHKKCDSPFATTNVIPQTFICLDFNKYKAYDFYAGARYYWNRWCDRVSLFVGGKIGLRHHKRIDLDGLTVGSNFEGEFFRRSTVFAGGGHLGLDYCMWGNLSLVLTAEVIASCGPRVIDAIALTDADAFNLDSSSLIPARVGTELMFPISLGLRYSF